jgi:hypothetical protein
MLRQFSSIDLTGAKLEYGESCLHILYGRLGPVNPESHLANGHLSVISQTKPSLLSNRVQIGWRNLEFELMMISFQDLTTQAELKLKFIARWMPSPKTEVLSF